MEIREVVTAVLSQKKIDKVFFAACGGSLAAFYPAKYFLERESRSLSRIGWHPANEFVHDAPAVLDEHSLVIICSHQGTTPETLEAGRIARQHGAAVIGFTYAKGSAIYENADYVFNYSWGEGVVYSQKKECLGLLLAMELLHQLEDWAGYDAATESFARYDDVVARAREMCLLPARQFAESNQNEKVIYTVGCGAGWGSAYMESICILLEMQWIHSGCIHSGEFFHGPLEITDLQTPFLVFVGEGATRALDERVLAFLEKYAAKTYIIDAKALGINVLADEVVEYFVPLLHNAVIDVYNCELAQIRKHPLSTRRYMWKVAY